MIFFRNVLSTNDGKDNSDVKFDFVQLVHYIQYYVIVFFLIYEVNNIGVRVIVSEVLLISALWFFYLFNGLYNFFIMKNMYNKYALLVLSIICFGICITRNNLF